MRAFLTRGFKDSKTGLTREMRSKIEKERQLPNPMTFGILGKSDVEHVCMGKQLMSLVNDRS